MYALMASATPYRGYTAKHAAEELLVAAWRSELEVSDRDLSGGLVEEEGILTKADVKRIEKRRRLGVRRAAKSLTLFMS